MNKNDTTSLLRWMLRKKIFASHDVLAWGVNNYSNRAERNKNDFRAQGLISKLPPWRKELLGYTCKDAVYEIDEKRIREHLEPSLFKVYPSQVKMMGMGVMF